MIAFHQASFEWSERNDEGGEAARFVLGPLDIEFPSGQLTLVTGNTGSGKTALLASLLGGKCLSEDLDLVWPILEIIRALLRQRLCIYQQDRSSSRLLCSKPVYAKLFACTCSSLIQDI